SGVHAEGDRQAGRRLRTAGLMLRRHGYMVMSRQVTVVDGYAWQRLALLLWALEAERIHWIAVVQTSVLLLSLKMLTQPVHRVRRRIRWNVPPDRPSHLGLLPHARRQDRPPAVGGRRRERAQPVQRTGHDARREVIDPGEATGLVRLHLHRGTGRVLSGV